MKKYVLFPLLALTSLGCSREQIAPATPTATTTQQAEEAVDFMVYLDATGNWLTQEHAGKPCELNYTPEGIVVADTPGGPAKPALYFKPAATESITVRLLDQRGRVLWEEVADPKTSALDMSMAPGKPGTVYYLDAYSTSHPSASRNVPRYIVKSDQ